MPEDHDRPPRRRALNLSVREDVAEAVRRLGLNASRIAEEALTEAVRAAERRAWLDENADAIAAHNRRVVERGLFNKGLRRF